LITKIKFSCIPSCAPLNALASPTLPHKLKPPTLQINLKTRRSLICLIALWTKTPRDTSLLLSSAKMRTSFSTKNWALTTFISASKLGELTFKASRENLPTTSISTLANPRMSSLNLTSSKPSKRTLIVRGCAVSHRFIIFCQSTKYQKKVNASNQLLGTLFSRASQLVSSAP
jgi:hypothetical protein